MAGFVSASRGVFSEDHGRVWCGERDNMGDGCSDENRVMKGGTRCRSVFTASIPDRGS